MPLSYPSWRWAIARGGRLYVEYVPPGFTAMEVQFGAPGRAEPFRASVVRTLGGAQVNAANCTSVPFAPQS